MRCLASGPWGTRERNMNRRAPQGIRATWLIPRLVAAVTCLHAFALAREYPTTLLDLQVSSDGIHWADQVQALPGSQLQVRATVTLLRHGPSTSAIGLASIQFQPTIAGWIAGEDRVEPFASAGTNATGGSVPDLTGLNVPTGRIRPFAFTGPTNLDPYIAHEQQFAGRDYVRLARASAFEWPHLESTSNSGGLVCNQRSFSNVAHDDQFRFAAQLQHVVIFKFALRIAASSGPRTLDVDAPLTGLSTDWQTGLPEATWFSSITDTYGQLRAAISVDPARIQIVPSPTVTLVGTAFIGIMVARRRSRVLRNEF